MNSNLKSAKMHVINPAEEIHKDIYIVYCSGLPHMVEALFYSNSIFNIPLPHLLIVFYQLI